MCPTIRTWIAGRTSIASCVLLILSAALASAQEELPAPKPAPQSGSTSKVAPPKSAAPANRSANGVDAPRRILPSTAQRGVIRPERRERLRALGGQVLDAFGPQLGIATEGGPSSAVDVSKLNEGLKAVIGSLLGSDTAIESLRIYLDPQGTNLPEDRIKLEADALLRRTAWSDLTSQATLSLAAQVARSDEGKPVALIDGRLRLQTPTVPLANYLLEQYKSRRAENKAKNEPTSDSDEMFLTMLDEKLAGVDRLDTLDDVADLLTAVSGVRLTAISQNIENLRNAARSATDPEARREFEAELATARAQRDRLFDIRPKIERGPDRAVQTIMVGMVGSELFEGCDMQSLDVRLTDREVSIAASAALTRWVELYPLIKPLAMGLLMRIQNGDARIIEEVRPWVSGALGGGSAIFGSPQPKAKPAAPAPPPAASPVRPAAPARPAAAPRDL